MREVLIGKRGEVALVDDEDYEFVSQFQWSRFSHGRTVYARTYILPDGSPGNRRDPGAKRMFLHAILTGFARTDHRDHNGLNNQRANLREATPNQNQANRQKQEGTSRFKGVYWSKRSGKWQASIQINCKRKHLGMFPSTVEGEIAAAKAYDTAAIEASGEFAATNKSLGLLD